MKLIHLAVALVIVYFLTRTEGFQDAASGGDFIEQKAQVSPDRNESMILMAQSWLRDKHKLCTYCIDTNKIQMYKNSSGAIKYVIRYMFMVLSGYPYGIAVDVEIVDDKITSLRTQPADGAAAGPTPFTDETAYDFVAYDEMAQKPSLPTA